MKDIACELISRLEAEKNRFKVSFEHDQDGLLILTAVREMDCLYYNLIRSERTEDSELQKQMHLMRLALPRIVTDALSAIPAFRHPITPVRSDRDLTLVVREMMKIYGIVEQGHRLAHSTMSGECEIQRFDDYQYDFVMPDVIYNMGQREDLIEQHYRNIVRKRNYTIMEEIIGDQSERMRCFVKDNVYVFDKYYMKYNTIPDLDEYFFVLASNEIRELPEWDSLDWNLKFGGVTLLKYILAATYFLSLAMKHDSFAEALIEKSPNICIRDIISIVRSRQQVKALMMEAINRYGPTYDGFTTLTCGEAQIILKVLSIRRDNLKLLESTMAPLPFLIEYSDATWVTSVSTIQLGTLSFLLNSLQHHFQTDYDRNQQTREGSHQTMLWQLLETCMPELTLRNNVRIRHDGKTLTDIDFAAVDNQDGTIILFQLKHQEDYGVDVRRQFIRATRMRREVGRWLNVVREWLVNEPFALRPTLGLRKTFTCERVYLAVIAKPSAHFVATLDLRNDAVYATWFQLIYVLNRLKWGDGPMTLGALAGILQRNMSHKTTKGTSLAQSESYHLPGVAYRVRSADAD